MNKHWKNVVAAANLAALSLGGVVGCKKADAVEETQLPAESAAEGACAAATEAGNAAEAAGDAATE